MSTPHSFTKNVTETVWFTQMIMLPERSTPAEGKMTIGKRRKHLRGVRKRCWQAVRKDQWQLLDTMKTVSGTE